MNLSILGQSLPENVFQALDGCCETIYPTIKSLLSILAALPISTASAERSFSTLRKLENHLRGHYTHMCGLRLTKYIKHGKNAF